MKIMFHVSLVVITVVCFNGFLQSMEKNLLSNYIHAHSFPEESIAHLAGYCQPHEKNILMKVCKAFNACLKKRELIVQANPATVNLEDKKKGMFICARRGDVKKLPTWLKVLGKEYINAINIVGMTAFQVATDNRHTDVMLLLAKNGADTNRPTPVINNLHKAVYNDDKKMVRALLKAGVSPNILSKDGIASVFTNKVNEIRPLEVAIHECNSSMVRLLCNKKGLDLKYSDVILVSKKGYFEIMECFLKKYGKAVHEATENGSTPLWFASNYNHIEIVKLLLAFGANATQKNQYGEMPLDVALKQNHDEVVRVLLEHIEPSGDLIKTIKMLKKVS